MATAIASVNDAVLSVLEQVTGTDEVRRNLDLDLFDQGLLDSLGVIEVIVGLSEQLGVEISPAEIERDQWTTPRKIVAFVKLKAGQPGR